MAERVEDGSVSVVLLAGGVGKRMGAAMPKQYLPLQGQPIALYSLDVFAAMREVGELVVVCDPSYDALFREHHARLPTGRPMLLFARPGAERQDSVCNGFEAIRRGAALVAIHDSARPLVQADDVRRCLLDALQVGAAVLGVRVKQTIKEVQANGLVVRTLERASLWEVQTPQVIWPELLRAGFDLMRREQLEVTDDVSIIEALGSPVRLTAGSYTNIKVTTPDDMIVAEGFLRECRGTLLAAAA
ncbi:hypothetical protein WJX81_007367 [Elliptochloris bilobata]|uniref:2-C-methyl-D-erythritol 4-phosphate cytidylyltransferase, chloroplastic n=1 Tax=Elliptochloris bilobata TaxID=381761 RepID=A0AAW1RKM8_9CHLO